MTGAFPMKRLIPAIAILLGWTSTAWAATPVTLTSLSQIHALDNGEGDKGYPVAFEATVTFFRGYENLMFVQDEDFVIYVRVATSPVFVPGDRVLVRGKTQGSFHPIVVADSVSLLHHGSPPAPSPATFEELIRSQFDSRLVTVHAVVRTADLIITVTTLERSARLQLLADGGHFEANVNSDDEAALKDLMDAEVEITGIAAGKFDNKMQQTGVVLYVSSLADIKVLTRASASPWSIPVSPLDRILVDYRMRDLTPRVRVRGTITYYQSGSSMVLQDGSKSLWIETLDRDPMRIGDLADATGFPDAHNRILTLTDAEIEDSHVYQPVTPFLATWRQLGFWSRNKPDGHQNDLVSIEGRLVTQVREAAQDEYILSADDRLFTAIYRHPQAAGELAPMMQVPLGSVVRVTGICTVVDASSIIPGEEAPFDILLRSFDDIEVVAGPSLLNTRNLLLAVGALLIVVFIVIARGWALERKVRRQTDVMSARTEVEADLERRRSHILEDINESRPLPEILVQIAAMVSSTLGDAPCWCEIADGERLGDCPQELNSLRIVRASIDARVGPALGTLFAALKLDTPPIDRETVALNNGARLATLAIETRRLYSDLRRRSEYDLLTDIPNRFAIEKFIDLQIEAAGQSGRMLGLIFIDLDQFKMVNDTYGHHVGDLYLQEAALRMSRQLLGRDMLARLGGDEFAALVSLHHGPGDLAKIVARLDHCFNRPFAVGGYLLNGAASIGVALYPQDGNTKDTLLSAADAAMYAVKNKKHKIDRIPAEIPHPESPGEDRA
jgi:diguanylate cyclase (GGDEF)-like protein